ncbi:MAG: OmpA family protein [Pirellulales bacterium]|nr:OmpA family protein [Pirellulales bacterium]
MAGKGGGAWKVAYADFVTAMMAFFMVMWIVAQGKPKVKEAVAEYFQDPYKYYRKIHDPAKAGVITPSTRGINLPHDKGSGTQIRPTKFVTPGDKTKLIKGQKNVEPGKIVIATTHDGKQERVGTIVLFDPQSSDLNRAAQEQLAILAPALRGKRHKIEIRGHAMRRPVEKQDSAEEDWNLTYTRCIAAMDYLIAKGVEADRFRLSQAGTYEPLTISGGAEDVKKNARVEVYLLDEITEELAGTREQRAERFKTPEKKSPEK